VDVLDYSHRSHTFPHESTTNQFFTESQFESYRSLGMFEADRMCRDLRAAAAPEGTLAEGLDLFASPIRWLERQRKPVTPASPTLPV
jgi:hypothetical protein